jgi:DNA-directed RNA polymerase specialized sigma24 family protein
MGRRDTDVADAVASGTDAAGRDPADVLTVVTSRKAAINTELLRLSAVRRAAVAELHAAGHSHAEIAALAGLSRGRIHQLLHGSRAGAPESTPRW